MTAAFQGINDAFRPELVKACLVLALVSAAVVIGLFAYLGQRSERPSYRYWTIGWLFYAVFLAAMIADEYVMQNWQMAVIPSGCAAMCALFMLAGNMDVIERPIGPYRLWAVALVLLGVNYAAHGFGVAHWFACPAFWALALAAVHGAYLFYQSRKPTVGTRLVVAGYLVWAALVTAVPLIEKVPVLFGLSGFLSSACLMLVAVGVILDHQLTNSEEKYRGLLEGVGDAVFIVNLATLKVLDANQAATRLARRSLRELAAIKFPELCPELHKEGSSRLDHRQMFANVFKPFNEFHVVRCDGSLVLCEGETTLARWDGRSVVQVRVRELDPSKNMGTLVRRAEKMSSLGQLIAGVAHELNNPLAVVMGYAQILAKQPNESQFLRTNVGHILHESERAATIVRDLLSFARPCEPKFSVVNLNELVNSVLAVRQRDLEGHQIEIRKQLQPGLSETKADTMQIEQVLNNVITNAMHAMSSKGAPRTLTVTTAEEGLLIRIGVSDTGGGIPAEVLPKIFEPFFTTKAPGKGTGLGLPICQNIMQEHHGRITVESVAGQGATFYLELPVLPCEAPVVAPVQNDTVSFNLSANGRCRLLVVDDEPGIRDVLEAILVSCGYQVTCVANGVEAMAEIKRGKFDMVITDMCMPEMDGERLYESIKESDPKLAKRVVFVTGDTVSTKSRSFLERTGNQWLSKPFNIRDVEEVVGLFLRERLNELKPGAELALNELATG